MHNSGGVTGYVWYLGANNNWKYNGLPADATINTTDPSITLTTDDCISTLSNVTATAFIGSTGYSKNISTCALSAPSATISGPAITCSAGDYSISSLPCGSNVTWSVNQAGIVPNPLTGLTTSLSNLAVGRVTLTANVTSSCGNYTILKSITVKGVPDAIGIMLDNVPCQPGRIVQSSTFTAVSSATLTYHWRSVSKGISTNIIGSGATITKKFALGSYVIFVWGSNECGETDEASEEFNVLPCSGLMAGDSTTDIYTLTVTPNPVSSNTIISLVPKAIDSKTNQLASISAIKIFDKLGNTKKQFTYKNIEQIRTVNLSSLPPGMYRASVYDGQVWRSVNEIVQ